MHKSKTVCTRRINLCMNRCDVEHEGKGKFRDVVLHLSILLRLREFQAQGTGSPPSHRSKV